MPGPKSALAAIPGAFVGAPKLAMVSGGSRESVVVRVDPDELVEHWTLLDDERDMVAGKRGPTRLGFALILKFYTRHGRFPAGRLELPDEAVAFVAKQVRVQASDLGFMSGRGARPSITANRSASIWASGCARSPTPAS